MLGPNRRPAQSRTLRHAPPRRARDAERSPPAQPTSTRRARRRFRRPSPEVEFRAPRASPSTAVPRDLRPSDSGRDEPESIVPTDRAGDRRAPLGRVSSATLRCTSNNSYAQYGSCLRNSLSCGEGTSLPVIVVAASGRVGAPGPGPVARGSSGSDASETLRSREARGPAEGPDLAELASAPQSERPRWRPAVGPGPSAHRRGICVPPGAPPTPGIARRRPESRTAPRGGGASPHALKGPDHDSHLRTESERPIAQAIGPGPSAPAPGASAPCPGLPPTRRSREEGAEADARRRRSPRALSDATETLRSREAQRSPRELVSGLEV